MRDWSWAHRQIDTAGADARSIRAQALRCGTWGGRCQVGRTGNGPTPAKPGAPPPVVIPAGTEMLVAARGAARGIPVAVPGLSLSTDNAAMIAAAGLRRFRAGQKASRRRPTTYQTDDHELGGPVTANTKLSIQ